MFDPERDDDADEMTDEEIAELKNRMKARGHLREDGTLNIDTILADTEPFNEFEAWYQSQHTGEITGE